VAGQSGGDAEARQVVSGGNLEVRSVWMKTGLVSDLIP
jgi:hypothetical protein